MFSATDGVNISAMVASGKSEIALFNVAPAVATLSIVSDYPHFNPTLVCGHNLLSSQYNRHKDQGSTKSRSGPERS